MFKQKICNINVESFRIFITQKLQALLVKLKPRGTNFRDAN